jgi:hypothetical protein
MLPLYKRISAFAGAIFIILASACGERSTAPGSAIIRVSVETSGGDPDDDGFDILVGSAIRRLPEARGTVSIRGLQAATYAVELKSVAENCTVSGPNPIVVDVPSDKPVSVSFAVICAATGIEVSVQTSGVNYRDGYDVVLDHLGPARIDSDGSLILSRLRPGPHTIAIDTGEDCTPAGPNELTVHVSNRALTKVAFEVTCKPPSVVTIEFGPTFDCGDPDKDPSLFRDKSGSNVYTVPVGVTVRWVYGTWMHRDCRARVASTSVPPGGAAFSSEMLRPGERFELVPTVPGTWEFTDLVSGGNGKLIVVQTP